MSNNSVIVIGARPNFMKAAAILHAAAKVGFPVKTIRVAQHHGVMADDIETELGLPRPDALIDVDNSTLGGLIRHSIPTIRRYIKEWQADAVIVVGDADVALAGTIAGITANVQVVHVEAGLRAFDLLMPEERNRIVVDSLSTVRFVTEPSALRNLNEEGLDGVLVGNTMVDTLLRLHGNKATPSAKPYALATIHRPFNVDYSHDLVTTLSALAEASLLIPIMFPIHPRTQAAMDKVGGASILRASNITTLPPLPYGKFVHMMQSARVVLTDSGGVQEETTFLGIPCLTLRDSTERTITTTSGTNRLVGRCGRMLLTTLKEILSGPARVKCSIDMWDGHAGDRIIKALS